MNSTVSEYECHDSSEVRLNVMRWMTGKCFHSLHRQYWHKKHKQSNGLSKRLSFFKWGAVFIAASAKLKRCNSPHRERYHREDCWAYFALAKPGEFCHWFSSYIAFTAKCIYWQLFVTSVENVTHLFLSSHLICPSITDNGCEMSEV